MRIKFHVGTGYVGSTKHGHMDIDDEEWAEMDEESREKLFEEMFEEWLWSTVDAGWVVEE